VYHPNLRLRVNSVKHLGLQSIDSSPSAQNDTYTVYPDLISIVIFQMKMLVWNFFSIYVMAKITNVLNATRQAFIV
ncbi:MAG: hypothetical protein ACM3SR_12030, partial [Ignavibacteriales bacterium]